MTTLPVSIIRIVCVAGALLMGACVSATPRFPASVSAALSDSDMRRMETEHLSLYYPEGRRDEAVRIASRLEGCAAALQQKTHIQSGFSRQRMTIVVPELPFNNAFVASPSFGREGYSVIPTHNTFDFSAELGLPADPSYIGCHEIVHYVHGHQVAGLWRWVAAVFGPVINPQDGIDAWIFEGLATYYETQLQPQTGRQAWPVWRGMFHAGVAEDRLGGGDLSTYKRASQWSNHYQVGSFFIEFLAERYGEDKLWRLLDVQGHSIFYLFGVGERFRSVYGRSLSTLIDEFADWTAKNFPARARPDGQRQVRYVGRRARYARAPSGVEAILASDRDAPLRLRIYRPDGSLWQTHALNQLVPPRALASTSATLASGLSFTADGRRLYLTMLDSGATYDAARLLALDLDQQRLELVTADLGGAGGAISPDGARYYFSRPRGDRWDLAALDIASGKVSTLAELTPRHYATQMSPSPDGAVLAVSEFSPERGFTLALYDTARGARQATIDTGRRRAYDVSYRDRDQLIYLAEAAGSFQVFLHDLATGATQQLSRAPYLAFAPRAQGDTVRFLNRDGWSWTLDEVALPARVSAPAPSAAPEPPAQLLPAPASAAPTIVSDQPYSHFDRLFVPQARGLLFTQVSGSLGDPDASFLVGLGLSGADRLSFHNWQLTGQLQPDTGLFGGSFGYVNTQLAPFIIGLAASQTAWEAEVSDDDDPAPRTEERLQREAEVYINRDLYGTINARLAAIYTDDQRPDDLDPRVRRRRMAGPSLALSYFAGDTTAYSGRYRALSASLRAALYPQAGNSLDADFGDLRAELAVTTPLPLSRRHTLSLRTRGRQLVGLRDRGLLQLGGASGFSSLARSASEPSPPDFDNDAILPTSIRFIEVLRGFENFAIAADRAAVADLTYRYPLIIDRGTATTLWILPSMFVRQLNLELFGAAALTGLPDDLSGGLDNFDGHLHVAAGAALSLDIVLWRLPLSLRYQFAQRVTDDEAAVHDVGLGLAL